jgi:outer membrane protein assembly factor BamB
LHERTVSRRALLGATGSAALAALAGCLGTGPSTASDAPWPMQGYNAGRTNHRRDASPPRGDVSVAWRTERRGRGPPVASPVAYGDRVLVPDRGVTAVDRADGTVAFHVDAPDAGLALAAASGYRTPTLVAGGDRVVAGFDATGGLDAAVGERVARRWRVGEGDTGLTSGLLEEPAVATTPVAAGGRVVHAVSGSDIVARDASSGRMEWRFGGSFGTDAFAVNQHVYVAAYAGSVYALDRTDGRVDWTHDENGTWSGVATADDEVFVTDRRGVTALHASDGERRWLSDGGDETELRADESVPTVVDDRVLLAGDDAVYGFDRATGERVWKRALDVAHVQHVPAAADLALVSAREDGLVAVDTATGRTAWEHAFAESWNVGPPVVADGRVYVVVGEELVCLEGSR